MLLQVSKKQTFYEINTEYFTCRQLPWFPSVKLALIFCRYGIFLRITDRTRQMTRNNFNQHDLLSLNHMQKKKTLIHFDIKQIRLYIHCLMERARQHKLPHLFNHIHFQQFLFMCNHEIQSRFASSFFDVKRICSQV